MNYDQILL